MYNQVIAAIRAVDPTTAVYVEPSPFTYEIGALLGRPLVMGTIDDPNIVLAVHNYCLGSATAGICGWIAGSLADNAQAYSVEHQIPMFMNEFGASDLSSDLTAGMDAAARTWLDDQPGYLPPVQIGEVIRGAGIGEVVESRCPAYAVGDVVTTLTGFQEYVDRKSVV